VHRTSFFFSSNPGCAPHFRAGETITVGLLRMELAARFLHRVVGRAGFETKWISAGQGQGEKKPDEWGKGYTACYGAPIHLFLSWTGPSLHFHPLHRHPCPQYLAIWAWRCVTSHCGCDTQLNPNGSGTVSSFSACLCCGRFRGTLFAILAAHSRLKETHNEMAKPDDTLLFNHGY
jgi:hypothetical protein